MQYKMVVYSLLVGRLAGFQHVLNVRVAESLHLVNWLGLQEFPDSGELRDTWVSLHGDKVGSDPLGNVKGGVLEDLLNNLKDGLID